MTVYVVSSVSRAAALATAPSFEAIAAALRAVQIPYGAWVGPMPRVIRRLRPLTLSGYETYVTWLLNVDIHTFAPLLVDQIRTTVDQQLAAAAGNFDPASVVEYNETINGPLAFWQSGDAARTRTWSSFPSSAITSSLEPDENPIGPDSPAVRPATPGETIANNAPNLPSTADLTKFLTAVGVLAAGGTALYLLWPALSGARAGERRLVANEQARRSTGFPEAYAPAPSAPRTTRTRR